MKKILGVLCFLAILAVIYLALTQPRDGAAPAMKDIGTEAGEIVDQVKGMYREYGAAALEQADDALGEAVEQADEAIGEAVGNAVESAKHGFFESLKESVKDFFENLTADKND